MDRRKALLASTIVTVTLVAGAAAFAANSGLVGSRSDNVGNLRPAPLTTSASAPTVVTVYVDPATGAVVAPPATVAPAAAAAAPAPTDTGQGHESGEREEGHGDD